MTRKELMEMTAEDILQSGNYQGYEYGLELLLEVEGEHFMPIVYISNWDLQSYFNLPYIDKEDVNELYWEKEDEVDLHFIKAQLDRIKAEIVEELKEKQYIKDFVLRLKEKKEV